MPEPIVALPCGSRSTTRTRCPMRPSPAARLTVVVVLPTPPFWLAMQKIRAMCLFGCDGRRVIVEVQALSTKRRALAVSARNNRQVGLLVLDQANAEADEEDTGQPREEASERLVCANLGGDGIGESAQGQAVDRRERRN